MSPRPHVPTSLPTSHTQLLPSRCFPVCLSSGKHHPQGVTTSLAALSAPSALPSRHSRRFCVYSKPTQSVPSGSSGEQLSPTPVLTPGQRAQTTDIKAKSALAFSCEVAKSVFLILYLQYIHLPMSQTHFINFVTSAPDVMNSVLLI